MRRTDKGQFVDKVELRENILNRMTRQKYNDMRLFNEQRKIEYIHNQKGADNMKIFIDVLDGRQTATDGR